MDSISQSEIKTVVSRFTLDDSLPIEIIVVEYFPDRKIGLLSSYATKTYSVRAHYGWAEKILCTGSYLKDANDIAHTIGEFLNVPVRDIELDTE